MMAFNNSAFHRIGSRHAYMALFDYGEYLGLPQAVHDAAAAAGTSPLHELRAAHAEPQIFMLQNRWMALLPVVAVGEPLTVHHLRERRIYGGWYTDWKARSKFLVRCADVGRHELQPYMVGNHYICKLKDRAMVGRDRATSQLRGQCVQPAPDAGDCAAATAALLLRAPAQPQAARVAARL